MDNIQSNPVLFSPTTRAIILGVVSIVAALVAAAAIVVLFVPPVAALVGLGAWILYAAAGTGALIAVVAALGAIHWGSALQETAVDESLAQHFSRDASLNSLPCQLNGHIYCILHSFRYEYVFEDSSWIKNMNHISAILTISKDKKSNPKLHVPHYLLQYDHFAHEKDDHVEQEKVLSFLAAIKIKNNLLIASNNYIDTFIVLVILECLLKKNISEKFVVATIKKVKQLFDLEGNKNPVLIGWENYLKSERFISRVTK